MIGNSFASDAVDRNTAWRFAPLRGFGEGLRRSLTKALRAKHGSPSFAPKDDENAYT
jgi:hypothetical protein